MSEKIFYDYSRPQPGDKGLVSIFTGDGKGKTTAAIGTAVRAAGHGLVVFIAFFAKGDEYYCGEANALSQLPNITLTSCLHKDWIDKENKRCILRKLEDERIKWLMTKATQGLTWQRKEHLTLP